jgi:UDP-N-acetylglucosamine diphosphorylase/glucosamine-1-phosphate N-acetyltransferase
MTAAPPAHVVIFEGSRWDAFAPLSLSRPVFCLATGSSSLLQKQLRHMAPKRLTLWVRPELESFCRERVLPHLEIRTEVNQPLDDEPALLLNGRTVHFGAFEYPPHEAVVVDEGEVVRLALARRPGLGPRDVLDRTDRWLGLLDLPHTMPQSRLVDSLWDLIYWNDESLVEDFADLHCTGAPRPQGPFHVLGEESVWFGQHVKLEPGCVLDGGKGPVMIGDSATIGANSVLRGPCSIGPHARIKPLTQIYAGTSIGPGCTVGGEVSHSIMLGHSNKSHEGFLGHSYVGKWANLGSGTTTSNLKNTYGEVRARVGSREVATGRQFVGAVIGDHSKTAVLTRLGAGTYVGFFSMLAGSGVAPQSVPSFTFWTDRGTEPYRMDKAIEVTRRVFARRERSLTETDQQIMRYVAQAAPTIEQE